MGLVNQLVTQNGGNISNLCFLMPHSHNSVASHPCLYNSEKSSIVSVFWQCTCKNEQPHNLLRLAYPPH